jgi:hypothetical protein
MSENNEVVEVLETEVAPEGDNVQISVEQICAAIISTIGSVDVPVEKLLANYQDKSISVNQNEETKVLTFTLIDNSEIAPEAEKE